MPDRLPRKTPARGEPRLISALRGARLAPDRTWAGRLAVTAAAVLAGWAVLQVALPKSTPAGIVVLGVVLGSLNALLAVGLVLVYRANRVINFAHGEMGGVAAVFTVLLVFQGFPYFAAVALGLVAAMLLGAVVETAFVRRFEHAPRLLLTVVTIALAQVLGFVSLIMPSWFGQRVVPQNFQTPLSGWRFEISPVVFDGNHVLIVAFAVAVVLGLTWLLGRTGFGIAVRASAENGDRAALCGIPTKALSTAVWVLAALLAASAAILQAPVIGLSTGALIGPGLLLRGLAAAVIGRMESLPVTIAAAVGLGVFEQAVYWAYGRSTVVDALLLVVILVGLIAQRRRFSRVDPADASTWQAVGEVRPIPRELRHLPEVRWGRLGVFALVGAIVVLGPASMSVSRQSLSAVVAIWAIAGVSLVVLTGWAGQISLGQFALVGIGAATAGSLTSRAGWDFVLALLAAGAAGLVAALVLGLPALRLRGFFLAVTTLAFAVTTSTYFLRLSWFAPEGVVDRPVLFGRIDLHSELSYYYFCLAVLGLVMAVLRGLRSSRVGRVIVGVRDNPRAAQSYGVNPVVAKLTAFALSGAIAGIAGGLLVHQQYRLQLVQYDPSQSLQAFTMAVIGGLGSLPGAVLGAVFVKGSQNLLSGPWTLFGTGFGLIVVLLVLPRGLGSLMFTTRDLLLRRVAQRRGIVVASLLADRRQDDHRIDDLESDPLGRRMSPDAGSAAMAGVGAARGETV